MIYLEKFKINLLSIYRPPICKKEIVDDFLNQFVCIALKYDNLITCGDINIDLLNQSYKQAAFLNTMKICNHNVINQLSPQMATRVNTTEISTTATVIDIFTSNIVHRFKKMSCFICENDLSDHAAIIMSCELENKIVSHKTTKEITKYNWTLISTELPKLAHNTSSFDEFHNELAQTKTKYSCIKNVDDLLSFYKPYFNDTLHKIKLQRNKFYKLYKRFPQNEFYKAEFQKLRSQLRKSLIHEKKKTH